jgi:rubredoxin---NAD+ reductase
VIFENGNTLTYKSLVLALGALTRKADFEGEGNLPLFSVNDLNDYKRFYAFLKSRKRICILGTGLIGCEFANDLALAGYTVNVVGNGAGPLQGLIPSAMGMALKESLEHLGVHWKFSNGIKSIQKIQNHIESSILAGFDSMDHLPVKLLKDEEFETYPTIQCVFCLHSLVNQEHGKKKLMRQVPNAGF